MIAVSVFLAIVYAFGWDFPSKLSILGNDVETHGNAFEGLAWIVFAYLIYEYMVHLTSRWRPDLYDPLNGKYNELISRWALQQMKQYYDESMRTEIVSQSKDLEAKFGMLKEPESVKLSNGNIDFAATNVSVSVFLPSGKERGESLYETYHQPKLELGWPRRRWWVARSGIGLLFRNEAWFEYVLPLVFPILALISLIIGPIPFLAR